MLANSVSLYKWNGVNGEKRAEYKKGLYLTTEPSNKSTIYKNIYLLKKNKSLC